MASLLRLASSVFALAVVAEGQFFPSQGARGLGSLVGRQIGRSNMGAVHLGGGLYGFTSVPANPRRGLRMQTRSSRAGCAGY